MPAIVVLGAQWGDEGKGKITDLLAREADAVVRYQGGHNAGHTVQVGESQYKLHLVPSGVFHKGTICLLGNGMVIDLPALVREIDGLEASGVDTSRLYISNAAHLILPYHQVLDAKDEDSRGADHIGTTRRGIGPAYSDKVNRLGIRMGDLKNEKRFRELLEANRRNKEGSLASVALDWDAMARDYLGCYQRLADRVIDVGHRVSSLIRAGAKVLLEGAQGTFLDLDHGTYPFVTSSNPTAGGACVGTGIGPTLIDGVLGVVKAYTTRVGAGPFPTELTDRLGDLLVDRGHEFGTTTGRRRRCGWLDTFMLRYAARINGLSSLAITKLDVLDSLDPIQVCSGYEVDGELLDSYPEDLATLRRVVPRYESFAGWKSSTSQVREYGQLPPLARTYLDGISRLTGVSVSLVSVGPDRSATMVTADPWRVR